ncbi:MAG: AAA family ATPase [Clostridia bacterium]|nr:AAA family ATPase [Clostridia bacterium]
MHNTIIDIVREVAEVLALKYSFQPNKNGRTNVIQIKNLNEKPVKLTPVDSDSPKGVQQILKEIETLIGLDNIKQLLFEIQAYVEIQKKRKMENLHNEPIVLHMIFKGNPGTGKTTVARYIGKLFKELNVLNKGHIVEIERADLVGEYIGHTAIKTKEQIQKALGGVLFIDEAYSLARGGEKDFGKEAIDVIVKAMEDYKDQIIFILAGYKDEMEWFLKCNPGLRSRFPIHIEFPDYSINELVKIAELMLKNREYILTKDAKIILKNKIQEKLFYGHEHSGNARMVRNLIEKAIRLQAVRLIERKNITREDLLLITIEDIQEATRAI